MTDRLNFLGAILIIALSTFMGGFLSGIAVVEARIESDFTGIESNLAIAVAKQDSLERVLSRLNRFKDFRITYVYHTPSLGIQTVTLIGPDDVLIEVER